jgi:hypothetical protein
MKELRWCGQGLVPMLGSRHRTDRADESCDRVWSAGINFAADKKIQLTIDLSNQPIR